MASDTFPSGRAEPVPAFISASVRETRSMAWQFVRALASLKLTIVLFAASIFLVFVGTLAQAEMDIWEVIDKYFRTPVAWVGFQVFLPQAFFPMGPFTEPPRVPGGFYFPGGWTIGALMMLNLLAAHAVRFTVQARGPRLYLGLGVIGLGVLVTWMVVAGGSLSGVQDQAFLSWDALWQLFLMGLFLFTCGVAATAAFTTARGQWTASWFLWPLAVALMVAVGFLLRYPEAKLDDPSMRILWHLIKATFAGVVLLVGCALAFKKRAGIVLLHAGVGLLMVSELLTGLFAVEGQMTIPRGKGINYVQDIRSVELAFIDDSDPREDRMIVVPQAALRNSLRDKKTIDDKKLPALVRVVAFFDSAEVLGAAKADELRTTLPWTEVVAWAKSQGITESEIDAILRKAPEEIFKLAKSRGVPDEIIDVFRAMLPTDLRTTLPWNELVAWAKSQGITETRINVILRKAPEEIFNRKMPEEIFNLARSRDVSDDEIDAFRTKVLAELQLRYPKSLATTGVGLRYSLEHVRGAAGTDSNGGVNLPAAYVELFDRESNKSLGVHLAAVGLLQRSPPSFDVVRAGGVDYEVLLRFTRNYRPYIIYLDDVTKKDYIGTSTPRDYSSQIRLIDEARNVDLPQRIWMNNPLRYEGETFYQNSYYEELVIDPSTGLPVFDPATGRPVTQRLTTLQVVTNDGWMIPYVACMIVVVGMAFQFMLAFGRFIDRQARQANAKPQTQAREAVILAEAAPEPSRAAAAAARRREARAAAKAAPGGGARFDETLAGAEPSPLAQRVNGLLHPAIWAPILVGASVVLLSLRGMMPPGKPTTTAPAKTKSNGANRYDAKWSAPGTASAKAIDWYALGQIPVAYQGRVQPLDSLARNTLMLMNNRSHAESADGKEEIPAIIWFMDVMYRPQAGRDYRCFRIDNLELLDVLELPRRKRFRYSLDEVFKNYDKFLAQAKLAHDVPSHALNVYQRKVLDLDRKIRHFLLRKEAFDDPLLRDKHAKEDLAVARKRLQELTKRQPPLVIPNAKEKTWETYLGVATHDWDVGSINPSARNPALAAYNEIVDAYANENAAALNRAVDKYLRYVNSRELPEYSPSGTQLEAFFNHANLLGRVMVLYVIAGVLALAAVSLSAFQWHDASRIFNRTSFWIIVGTFVLHTAVLVMRMYISGRPPVTNLYSTAPFIGWACVLAAIIMESIYRLGIGNLAAALSGFFTLQIAGFLASTAGDTITVMQAVLDTQFWLTTHVLAINVGYAGTGLAALLGVLYILYGVCTPNLTKDLSKHIARMIYGTLCMALFFSFFGTVLGGLWADDSWGRFWGWDPKENGALIIVIWNALVLHARWDGMVKDRGLAVLAAAGNIPLGWSWFGVNELGVGLHTYGFTEGVLLTLSLTILGHLIVIAVGSLPLACWWSGANLESTAPKPKTS